MRLRSIPPRTNRTVATERGHTASSEQVVQLRQHLQALQERLRHLGNADGLDASAGHLSGGLRFGDMPHTAAEPRLRFPGLGVKPGSAPSGGYGRVYRRPGEPRRSIDHLIPPRSGPSAGRTIQTASESAEGYVVRIAFPVAVQAEEIRWELHGDVLEVEYLGKAFTYYHAFLVPGNTTPAVEQAGRDLVFRFPSRGTVT